eukprot:279215_1
MPSSRRKVKRALSSIEKFIFEHICTTLSHTIATPFLKLKCILQARSTMLEYNISTNLSSTCLQNPSMWSLFNTDNIDYLFSGTLCSIFRVVVQTMSNLAIKEPIKKSIIGRNKRRGVSYAMILSKKFIAGYIGNVIAINFTLYLTRIVINKRLCLTDSDTCNPYRFGLFQPAFLTTVCKSFVFRSVWFTSCYLVEPYIEARWMKKTVRKILTYTVQHPIDTIRTRQILTNETGFDAARHIAQQHGWHAFFHGFIPKMWQEFIFLSIGLCMEKVRYQYAEWKYDISGIQKKRKGIMNLRDLCAYRNALLFQETLLVHGYIRSFTESMSMDLYIPRTLIHLIETRFYHDTKYDIMDVNMARLVDELCQLKEDDIDRIDALLASTDIEDQLENLLNERGFQNVWKYQMRKVVRGNIDLGKDIHYLGYVARSSLIVAMFSCDECNELIDDIMHVDNFCAFWECGHVWCNECEARMRIHSLETGDDTMSCSVCNVPCNDWYQYSIKFRDFESLLRS